MSDTTTEEQILHFATSQWGEKDTPAIALKLCGEMGEFAEAVHKIGEGRKTIEDADDEAGDILIVLSQYAAKRGTTLEALRAATFAKIQARAEQQEETLFDAAAEQAKSHVGTFKKLREAGLHPALGAPYGGQDPKKGCQHRAFAQAVVQHKTALENYCPVCKEYFLECICEPRHVPAL